MAARILCGFVVAAAGMSPAVGEAEVRLKLATETAAGLLAVTPLVEAATEQRLRYEVTARKDGPSGTTETRQGGTVNVRCCEPSAASTLKWNVGAGDRYTISVKLFSGDRMVAEASLRHP